MNFKGKTTVTPSQCYTHANNLLLESVGNKDVIRRAVNLIYVNTTLQGLNAGLCVSAWCIDALAGGDSPIRSNDLVEYIERFTEMEVIPEVENGYDTIKKIRDTSKEIEGSLRIVISDEGLPIKQDKSGKSKTIGNFPLGEVIEAVPVDLSWGALYSGGFVNINQKYSFPIDIDQPHIDEKEELTVGTVFYCTEDEIPVLYGAGTNYHQASTIKNGDIIKIESYVYGWPVVSIRNGVNEYVTLGFLNYEKYKDLLKAVAETKECHATSVYEKDPDTIVGTSETENNDNNQLVNNETIKPIYHVRCGEFRSYESALNRKTKLLKAGINCEIQHKAPFFYCVLLETCEEGEAKSMCQMARKKGFPTNIHSI